MNETPPLKWTVWIAITAVFTALTTVATVVLSISLPAGGYFNFGEAVIYVAALLLGPIIKKGSRIPLGAIVAGISGSVGAMLGDAITGYVLYIPATLVLKFAEGFVAGILFKRLKAEITEERLHSGITTMRILLSGFFIAAAVIIIGVNYNPTVTLLWIAIGSAFIVIAFVSILRGKIPLYYMILSVLCGGIIMFIGYFLYETFTLMILTAYTNLPWNVIQALVGIVVAIPVYQALLKAEVLRAL